MVLQPWTIIFFVFQCVKGVCKEALGHSSVVELLSQIYQ